MMITASRASIKTPQNANPRIHSDLPAQPWRSGVLTAHQNTYAKSHLPISYHRDEPNKIQRFSFSFFFSLLLGNSICGTPLISKAEHSNLAILTSTRNSTV